MEDQGPRVETTFKQNEDPVKTNKNRSEGQTASKLVAESTDRRLAVSEDADVTEERVSKLECLTCGILRRRRARARRTPRLEFAEDPPQRQQQQEEVVEVSIAVNTDGQSSSQREHIGDGAGAADSPKDEASAKEEETATMNHAISNDGASPRY